MAEKHRSITPGRIAALVLFTLLAGCTQLEKDVGQCEPGVEDISNMATIAPVKC